MLDILIYSPLTYDFIQRGLLAAVIVGITLRSDRLLCRTEISGFYGRCLAHAILPGVAIAYLLKCKSSVGCARSRVPVALGIGYVSTRGTFGRIQPLGSCSLDLWRWVWH